MRLAGIEGRVAVVTGSSSGIGLRVAETLRALGAKVAGLDVGDAATGLDLALSADVRDETEVDRAFARAESELGPVEMLVTCAGVFTPMVTPELGLDEWRRTIDINLTGTFLCAKRALGPMRERGYGTDRDHLVRRRPGRRIGGVRPLRGVEGRRDRADQGSGQGVRPRRGAGQRRRARAPCAHRCSAA